MSKQGATPNKPSNSMEILAKIFVGILIMTVVGLFVYLLNPFGDKTPSQPVDDRIKPKQINKEQPDYQFYELLPDQQVSGVPTKPINNANSSSQKPDAVVVQKKSTKAETSNKTASTPTADMDTAQNSDNLNEQTNISQLEAQTSKAISKAKAVIENAQTDKTYILQINSFDNADDADKRRAEVLIAGVDAQVVKKRLNDDSMIYQVISRQMPNVQMAQQAQKRLQNSAIDSLIVEQHHK